MLTEELGSPRQLTNDDIRQIINHLETIISQCTDITKTKSFARWIIESRIYWILCVFFGDRIHKLKSEERINGYTTFDKHPSKGLRH